LCIKVGKWNNSINFEIGYKKIACQRREGV
jgi:hypothetical protein